MDQQPFSKREKEGERERERERETNFMHDLAPSVLTKDAPICPEAEKRREKKNLFIRKIQRVMEIEKKKSHCVILLCVYDHGGLVRGRRPVLLLQGGDGGHRNLVRAHLTIFGTQTSVAPVNILIHEAGGPSRRVSCQRPSVTQSGPV